MCYSSFFEKLDFPIPKNQTFQKCCCSTLDLPILDWNPAHEKSPAGLARWNIFHLAKPAGSKPSKPKIDGSNVLQTRK